MKHKVAILIVTSLMIIILLAFFFWFNNQRQQDKQLIDFVPKDTWKYFEINFDNGDLNTLLKEQESIKTAIEKFLIKNGLPINVWKGECKITKLALAQVEAVAAKQKINNKVWLIYSPANIKTLEVLELKNYYLISLTENIVALTDSQPVAIEIKNNKNSYNLSLTKHSSGGMINGYTKLASYFDKIDEDIAKQKMIEEYFDMKDNLNWQINIDADGEMIAEFNLPVKNNYIKQVFVDTNNEDFIIAPGMMVVRNFNGDILLELLENKLEEQFNGGKDLFEKFLEDKYKIDIKRLYTFFEQPFSVVVQPKNNQLVWNNILNTQNNQNYFYALVWDESSKFIKESDADDLERLIQNYLAFKFPIAKNKILSDGTSGFELVADPAEIVWQSKILTEGREMRFLIFKNYEYAYIKLADRFIFANSQKIIENILRAENKEGIDEFYDIFISPLVIEDLRLTDLSEIYLGGTVKNNNLEIKAKLLWESLD